MASNQIVRSRLLEAIGSQPRQHWLIEAGGGFGKTVLASQMRSFLTTAFVVIWDAKGAKAPEDFVKALSTGFAEMHATDIAELLAASEPVASALADTLSHAAPTAIAIDRAQDWDESAQTLISDLLTASPPNVRFLVFGRSFEDSLRDLKRHPSVASLTADDLAFTAVEIEELARAQSEQLVASAEVLHQATDGWPVAAQALLDRLAASPDWQAELSVLGATPEPVTAVLRRYVKNLAPDDQQATLLLAALPAFDAALVTALGQTGLIERLADSGLPIAQRFDQKWEFCGPVRDLLIAQSPGQPTVDPSIVDHLVAQRDIKTALDYCMAGAEHVLAAHVIASLQIRDDILLDLTSLNRAMATIGGAAEQAPRALLVQSRANISGGGFDVGLDALERAERIFGIQDPNLELADHVETIIELALVYAFMEKFPEAEERVQRCAPLIGEAPSVARAIMLETSSVLLAFDHSAEGRQKAESALAEAIDVWREVGEPRGAMAATLNLVANVLIPQARYHDGLKALDAAAELRPVSIMNTARLSLMRGTILPLLGRSSDALAELERAIRLFETISQDWLAGWAWWRIATVHSLAGNAEATADAIETGERCAGEALLQPIWITLHSAAIENWLRLDNADRATQHLEALEELTDKTGWIPTSARWLIEARTGDAAEATRDAEDLLSQNELPRERRWLIQLYNAMAHQRVGNAAAAKTWLATARAEAKSIGFPSILELAEPRLVSAIEAPVGGEPPNSSPETEPARTAPVEIKVLGSFEIRVNGQLLEVPSGHVSTLIKLLVLADTPMHTEVLIDRLWPDADVPVGRKRLRNVLLRMRNAGVDFVDRDGDMITVTSAVGCDLWRARKSGRDALAAPASSATCAGPIAWLEPTLLPQDRYDDWAEEERSSVLQLRLALLDHSAQADAEDGNVEAAVASLKLGSDLDPLPNDRRSRCAALLRAAGRHGAAERYEDS